MTSNQVKDVIVVGGGIFGLSVAYCCARNGQRVKVIDRAGIGSGASGGVVGAMSPHTPDEWNPKKAFQYEALVSAESFWAEVDARSGLSSGYGRVGRITPNMNTRVQALSIKRAASAPDIWGPRFKWDLIDTHPLIDDSYSEYGLVYDTFSARIHPRQACASLLRACQDLGVETIAGQTVTAITDHAVSGDWGEFRADAIVLAAGAQGFELLDRQYNRNTGTGVKGQSAVLDICLGDAPTIAGEGLYIVPHTNGTVGVGSTSEVTFDDPYSIDAQLDDVLTKARRLCPAIRDAPVLSHWAGLRPKAAKRTPMVGKLPNLDGIYVAGGGFKIGFGIAHKIGQLLADQIAGLDVDLPPTFLPTHHLS